ncbi:MAG: hypothetical protein K5866_07510 [Treponema sp.]|nr:hypothetical protein [Treponema sp.]
MSYFKNFKSVTYCVAQWADHIDQENLKKQLDWLQKYIGIDKVYLETYRGSFARKEQLQMIKKILKENGIEVSGGITTVTPDLDEKDKDRQRLFETFCYCNEGMRNRLKEVSEYTASLFDEFIIDDFFFTQCMCQDCIKEKGNRSWSEFRLEKMMEVSKNLIIDPAKKVNPKCKVIIKYPNWRESYQDTGYNPGQQREIFDSIYTGTETRHGAQQDQHLPRYLSYSLPRYMENVAPGRNGGGWFDPFECDRIDSYLEQAYLTAFSKCKEIMTFCWPAIYNNKRVTPLGFQLSKIDKILDECGNPRGLKVYIPFNSCGDDHIEDYLGMIGLPVEPTPDFPEYKENSEDSALLVTQASWKDPEIVSKITDFVAQGGKVIATSGFMLKAGDKLSELTSAVYENKSLIADEFQVSVSGLYGRNYIKSREAISFPMIGHRNNSSWSILNAGHGEYHESLIMYDTYGKGKFEILNLPEMPSRIVDLPAQVLTVIRQELLGNGKVWIDGENGVSLFTYDNDSFGLYCYTNDGCKPVDFNIHINESIWALEYVKDQEEDNPWRPKEIRPLYVREKNHFNKCDESVFHMRLIPGDFQFFKIKK